MSKVDNKSTEEPPLNVILISVLLTLSKYFTTGIFGVTGEFSWGRLGLVAS